MTLTPQQALLDALDEAAKLSDAVCATPTPASVELALSAVSEREHAFDERKLARILKAYRRLCNYTHVPEGEHSLPTLLHMCRRLCNYTHVREGQHSLPTLLHM